MRKFILLTLLLTFSLAVMAPAAAEAKTLRMGLSVSNKSLPYKAAEIMAAHVKEATGGEYTIKLHPSQQLGNAKEMMQMLKMGTIDLQQATNATPPYLKEGRNFQVMAAPYCFQSSDEMKKFYSSPVFMEMVDAFGKGGVKLIGYNGARSPKALTTTDTKVSSPADIKGLKLRLPGTPAALAYWRALGASPTPLPFSEFFTAAKTGVVEGQDNGILLVYPNGFYEVQKYYHKTDHAFGAWMVYGSQKKWAKWPEKLKKAIMDGLKKAADYNDAEVDKRMAEGFAKVKEKGMLVLDIDKTPFIEVAKKVWKDLDGKEWDQGFMDRVQKQLEEYRK